MRCHLVDTNHHPLWVVPPSHCLLLVSVLRGAVLRYGMLGCWLLVIYFNIG